MRGVEQLSHLYHRAGAGIPTDRAHQCLSGRTCYADSLKITIAACTFALVLALYAGWKDYRTLNDTRRGAGVNGGRGVEGEPEWEDEL